MLKVSHWQTFFSGLVRSNFKTKQWSQIKMNALAVITAAFSKGMQYKLTLPIICDCRPVAGVMGRLDIGRSTLAWLASFMERERRGIIMFGVTDRSSTLQYVTDNTKYICTAISSSDNIRQLTHIIQCQIFLWFQCNLKTNLFFFPDCHVPHLVTSLLEFVCSVNRTI